MVSRGPYLAKRIVGAFVSFMVVATFLFFLFRAIPGDVVSLYAGPGMSEEGVARLRERYGFNEPLYVQYLLFIQGLFNGTWGVSFIFNDPVTDILFERLLNTFSLMIPALLLSYTVGPFIGAFIAWRRGSNTDAIGVTLLLVFFAAPVFWSGMVVLMVFSFFLGWFPSGGMVGAARSVDGIADLFLSLDFLHHLALPLLVTTLYFMAQPAFFMRSTMIEKLNSDFITMARAEGLPTFSLIYRHAARNSMLPVLHHAAVLIGAAAGGSVLIEVIFSWPGVGRTMWEAVEFRDYPLAQGAFLLMAGSIISMNFIIDLISVYVDPRATQEEAGA